MSATPPFCTALFLVIVAGIRVSGTMAADVSPSPPRGLHLAQADSTSVWCYDEEHSLVTRTAKWRCEGRVVSAEDAERIKQERVRRIQRILQKEKEPVVPGRRLSGTGTGFFITRDGQVITNHHVVEGCKAVTVTPAFGEERVASVRRLDRARDLALLETRSLSPGAAVFRRHDEVVPNETVTVVGYPLRGKVVIRPMLVSGHVHAGDVSGSGNVFVMKIDIRQGNSGGPILDGAGRTMGVVFAKVDTPKVFEKTGKVIRDVGLGIRLHVLRDFLRPLSIRLETTDDDKPLGQEARFALARKFVAQIGCWR